MRRIYFDHIAGTPINPEVVKAMLPFLKHGYGNPQSFHTEGRMAAEALETSRAQVADLIGASPNEIVFTSNGSEANNLAVKGIALSRRKKGSHLIYSAVEHVSVINAVKSLERLGFTSTEVGVDGDGMVDPDEIRKAIEPDTVLVTVMTANSEVGTIEPVETIASICRDHGIAFHTDAVAAVGNLPIQVDLMKADTLSLASNQFYGPRGTAALYIRKGTGLIPLIDGGIQEFGKRAGAENLAGIVGMGKAAEIAAGSLAERIARMNSLRDRLIQELPEKIEHVVLTGHPKQRLPYHASFGINFVEGEAMLLSLDMKGIAVSSGSACTSKSLKASHVLLAMGYDHAIAQASLVFSLVEGNSMEDLDYLFEFFPPIIERLRQMSPLYTEFLEEKET